MDRPSLAALLDDDREMILANLARDRSLPAAQAALEKAIDRVMYRYTEQAGSEALRDGAQYILQAMKNALPMIDAVGEARNWKREAVRPEKKGLTMGPLAVIALLVGLVLVIASVVGVMLAGRLGGALAFVKALLPAALGCAALFWAGVMAARPRRRKGKAEAEEAVRTEYLVDVEKAYHVLRGAMLLADGQLERMREDAEARDQQSREADPAGGVSGEAMELFSQLLEAACASKDEGSKESAAAIRFYLHGVGIDVIDWEPGREQWFEFLPADRPGTLRPALMSGGKLLKKGLAAR